MLRIVLALLLSCLVVLVLVAPAQGKSAKSTKEDEEYAAALDQVTEMLEYVNSMFSKLPKPKRECRGYMCAYNHLSGTAAAKSAKKQLQIYLYECARNPKCSPGKRRRRSIAPNTSLLSKYLLRHMQPS
ncbi:unnamed protein product [Lymnaea stagnalis]|uniref:Uncharacterized protein n=1 Tax=Lymnaea stagnalis TaxID=6523 RepID=A0AAV2HFL3_LYMST